MTGCPQINAGLETKLVFVTVMQYGLVIRLKSELSSQPQTIMLMLPT